MAEIAYIARRCLRTARSTNSEQSRAYIVVVLPSGQSALYRGDKLLNLVCLSSPVPTIYSKKLQIC